MPYPKGFTGQGCPRILTNGWLNVWHVRPLKHQLKKRSKLHLYSHTTLRTFGMDLIGKLACTDSGNQYICVIIDYLTKWPQAYPLRSKSAEEVTNCIIKFFNQFEAPKRILTDQGREFVNQINQNVSKILAIKRSLCSPYHPHTNGLVERMNGTIQRTIMVFVRTVRNQVKNTQDQKTDDNKVISFLYDVWS
ncbi:KRAB-A domain-containing protein 2-like [Silurus meridionalis]|uniref:KRAB-A domain-containing protein 2-like n=1 Tax=Silurus meridionalis TaxID=175797 RepID=UPI001EEB874D|nr:KRAB-A domain-containing protein 2-like [Silurus meridionalis]